MKNWSEWIVFADKLRYTEKNCSSVLNNRAKRSERGARCLDQRKDRAGHRRFPGIGREIARQLLLAGWQVAVNYCRSQQAAATFAREMSPFEDRLLLVQADVSHRREVDAMVQTVLGRFGQVDLLVNNAGIAQQKLFTDLTYEEWRRIFAVDLDGSFTAVRPFSRR